MTAVDAIVRCVSEEATVPVASDVALGARVVIHHPELVNLYGCRIGDNTRIGSFVEIQRGVVVGRACKISSHIFVPRRHESAKATPLTTRNAEP